MTHKRPRGPVRKPDFATEIVRMILLSMNPESQEKFISRLTEELEADVQSVLYRFIKAMLCSWAGQADFSGGNAFVIEDCRKICDMMGWPLGRVDW